LPSILDPFLQRHYLPGELSASLCSRTRYTVAQDLSLLQPCTAASFGAGFQPVSIAIMNTVKGYGEVVHIVCKSPCDRHVWLARYLNIYQLAKGVALSSQQQFPQLGGCLRLLHLLRSFLGVQSGQAQGWLWSCDITEEWLDTQSKASSPLLS